MGERGPQPKYTPEQRALQGNPGNRALPAPVDPDTQFPDILQDVPPAPDWLYGKNGDTGALAVNAWGTIAPILVNARQFREGDQIALARYCRYVAEWVGLTEEIDDKGMIIVDKTPNGGTTTKRNPAFTARGSVESAMAALEKELGLSPRARIEVQKRLMGAIKDQMPLAGSNKTQRNGPIGALNSDDEEDE